MKKIKISLVIVLMTIVFTSCERVAPNFAGVLMENFGKNGKSDYSRQQGRVTVIALEQNYSKSRSMNKGKTLETKYFI